MEDSEFKIEVGGLWIEDRHSKFEDSIKPHLHLKPTFLFILCRKSRYFEDIVKLCIFRLRTIHNFFQVWLTAYLKTSCLYICLNNVKKRPMGQ